MGRSTSYKVVQCFPNLPCSQHPSIAGICSQHSGAVQQEDKTATITPPKLRDLGPSYMLMARRASTPVNLPEYLGAPFGIVWKPF